MKYSRCYNHEFNKGIAIRPNWEVPLGHRDYNRTHVTIWDGKYGWFLGKCLKCVHCGKSVTDDELAK